jgi:clan AA aspartic protease (TIGR02281 family)
LREGLAVKRLEGRRIGVACAGIILAFAAAFGEGFAAQTAGGTAGQSDSGAALQRYRLGAAQGDPAGVIGLGGLFESGSAVPIDFAKAYAFFHLVVSMSSATPAQVALASTQRDAVGAKMSAAQFARAQELVALCYGSDINRCSESIFSAGGAPVTAAGLSASSPGGRTVVQLEQLGGVYVLPAVVNGAINMRFLLDSGATDVSIPADAVAAMVKAGFVKDSDFLGEQTYTLADGSKVPSKTFQLRSLKVGDVLLENVKASVSPEKAPPLLGQSFFGRLKSWSLNNTLHALIID